MSDTAQRIRPPEQVFDGDNLPDDLKWIMSHFGLPKNDPAVVLIAWHWYRVMNIRDHFAVTALPTILAHRPDDSADKKAAAAYQIADAMLKHRKVVEGFCSDQLH